MNYVNLTVSNFRILQYFFQQHSWAMVYRLVNVTDNIERLFRRKDTLLQALTSYRFMLLHYLQKETLVSCVSTFAFHMGDNNQQARRKRGGILGHIIYREFFSKSSEFESSCFASKKLIQLSFCFLIH